MFGDVLIPRFPRLMEMLRSLSRKNFSVWMGERGKGVLGMGLLFGVQQGRDQYMSHVAVLGTLSGTNCSPITI